MSEGWGMIEFLRVTTGKKFYYDGAFQDREKLIRIAIRKIMVESHAPANR